MFLIKDGYSESDTQLEGKFDLISVTIPSLILNIQEAHRCQYLVGSSLCSLYRDVKYTDIFNTGIEKKKQ